MEMGGILLSIYSICWVGSIVYLNIEFLDGYGKLVECGFC